MPLVSQTCSRELQRIRLETRDTPGTLDSAPDRAKCICPLTMQTRNLLPKPAEGQQGMACLDKSKSSEPEDGKDK